MANLSSRIDIDESDGRLAFFDATGRNLNDQRTRRKEKRAAKRAIDRFFLRSNSYRNGGHVVSFSYTSFYYNIYTFHIVDNIFPRVIFFHSQRVLFLVTCVFFLFFLNRISLSVKRC